MYPFLEKVAGATFFCSVYGILDTTFGPAEIPFFIFPAKGSMKNPYKNTMANSFFMSNMSPQKPAFNRGIWKELEALIRYFAITEQKIVVVTGPILPKEKTITIGTNQVTVPTHYYKVIFDLTPPQKMIGFILPNEGSDEPLATFAVTVDAVEKATGLNFFSRVPNEEQERLERTISVKAWKGL